MQQGSGKNLTLLRNHRRKEGLSQEDIAKSLGISQSTVSRRERKPPQRHSDASYKLCSYAENAVGKVSLTDQRVIKKAFDEVWHKSEAHAVALSKIISAFVELCRSEGTDKEETPG